MKLPSGFQFSGIASGIKKSGKPDLAILSTGTACTVAGVYTQNVVRAASIDWNREITPSDSFRAVVINSGNANACTGIQGSTDNQKMAERVAERLSVRSDQVLVLSTGVIGHLLPMEIVQRGIDAAIQSREESEAGFCRAAEAILTTDKGPKTVCRSISIGEREIRLAGMAKGAGMIGPNMATMLAVMITDAKLNRQQAQSALADAAKRSFNRISVEGHTSTNDALLLICSGDADQEVSETELAEFTEELTETCIELAKKIPSDGEGATHLVTITVTGAQTERDADQVARTVASSALVKTAITGADPNWGRIVSAAGYSQIAMDVTEIDLSINGHPVFQSGHPVEFEAATVSQAIANKFETRIDLSVGSGPGQATHWTSDLTVDYVRFNSEYHT